MIVTLDGYLILNIARNSIEAFTIEGFKEFLEDDDSWDWRAHYAKLGSYTWEIDGHLLNRYLTLRMYTNDNIDCVETWIQDMLSDEFVTTIEIKFSDNSH